MARSVLGIHHITAITSDADKNIAFYTKLLGLRLVKVTVNFDDPSSYHLYYGDGSGNPGTILTFFVWAGAHRGRIGNNQVTTTSFAIPSGATKFWQDRLTAHQVAFQELPERFGERSIAFSDPDGLGLELIETATADHNYAWTHGEIPSDAAICGFHSATLLETGYESTARLLSETMGLLLAGNEQSRYRFEISGDGPARVVDVVCAPGGIQGRVEAGTVHHIAWRTPSDSEQAEWLSELTRLGYNLSPVMDRVYFHSIYYREPGGILFEIATDPPGFTRDEALDKLGTSLRLPPWFESHRPEIEASLSGIAIFKKKAPGV